MCAGHLGYKRMRCKRAVCIRSSVMHVYKASWKACRKSLVLLSYTSYFIVLLFVDKCSSFDFVVWFAKLELYKIGVLLVG